MASPFTATDHPQVLPADVPAAADAAGPGADHVAATDVCRSLCEMLGIELAFVSRFDGDDVIVAAVWDAHQLGMTAGSRSPVQDTFCGRALNDGAPRMTDDLAGSAHADVPARSALGVSSYAMLPLLDQEGQIFGTLCVLDRRHVLPDEQGMQLMRLLGGLLARDEELDRVRRREAAATETLIAHAAALETSQDRYRSLVDEMRDIIVRVNADGTIEFVNEAWTRLTGIPTDATIGRGCFDHVHPDDQRAATEHLMAVAAGTDNGPREIRFRGTDGGYRWMSVGGQARFGPNGELIGFTGMLQDVTDRRLSAELVRTALEDAEAARDEAQSAQAEAERASRAKTEFLSRMSHELRTPLNAILGFAQLLELSTLAGQDAEHVGFILDAGRHLLELINEVLDVVRIESGRLAMSLEPVDVTSVIAHSLALVRTAAADRQLSVTAPPEQTAHVIADQQRLTQVLVNLLSNAVKYNSEGGRLVVTVDALSPAPYPGREPEHGWLRIGVTDTGHGIAAQRLSDAFVPFERLGAELTDVEGTGIGLSLSKTLVEAMGGHIGVDSEIAVGSTFYVDLPAAQPLVPVPPADRRDIGTPMHTVLYVEDNRSNVTLMERMLAHRPTVQLVSAPDGATGLTMARHLRPHLILLDLHLPVLNGDGVLAALRSEPPLAHTAVIVVTADLTAGTERRLLNAGATAFLSKPIDMTSLLAAVDEHLPARPAGRPAGQPDVPVPVPRAQPPYALRPAP